MLNISLIIFIINFKILVGRYLRFLFFFVFKSWEILGEVIVKFSSGEIYVE